NACSMSQFDALARILLGVPLSTPWLVSEGTFCMTNLLGDIWLAQGATAFGADLDVRSLTEHPQVIDMVLYGKKEARAKRKMGHFVTYGETADSAVTAARNFKQALLSRARTQVNI
ncbi:MAG TPA: hypothetical protein VFA15_02745, partial [Nitrososphaera sp.]|nr:hypothetical protein [Nitrososphaera sp.]